MKNYFTSFYKFYLLRKPRLLLTVVLTIIIFIWINHNFQVISSSRHLSEDVKILIASENLFLIFLKPIFVYIAGILIIKNI